MSNKIRFNKVEKSWKSESSDERWKGIYIHETWEISNQKIRPPVTRDQFSNEISQKSLLITILHIGNMHKMKVIVDFFKITVTYTDFQ